MLRPSSAAHLRIRLETRSVRIIEDQIRGLQTSHFPHRDLRNSSLPLDVDAGHTGNRGSFHLLRDGPPKEKQHRAARRCDSGVPARCLRNRDPELREPFRNPLRTSDESMLSSIPCLGLQPRTQTASSSSHCPCCRRKLDMEGGFRALRMCPPRG